MRKRLVLKVLAAIAALSLWVFWIAATSLIRAPGTVAELDRARVCLNLGLVEEAGFTEEANLLKSGRLIHSAMFLAWPAASRVVCGPKCGSSKMARDYKIVIRCPVTGKMIDSGIRTSGREAVNSELFQDGAVSCPYCHQMHSFEDNYFLDVDRAASSAGLWRPNR